MRESSFDKLNAESTRPAAQVVETALPLINQ